MLTIAKYLIYLMVASFLIHLPFWDFVGWYIVIVSAIVVHDWAIGAPVWK